MPSQTDRLNLALADRYRIERHLGEGGMATVYLAQDLRHDRKVALKLLKPELAAVLGAERFVQEIKTTAALQHPHILPLFDSGTADGFLFYVMPYIEGETLRDKLNRETQLGVDESVRIARDVADALDYAHRHGVIHRDIKPENILLHDGRPMVADFGIALAVSAAAGGRMTETGLSLGTPHYMSPEQATAQKDIDARSDVYSLGSVLYEMLTGSPPHTGASAQQIIMKIITETPESVTKYRKTVPPNVAAAVAKSLEKLPADRFESAKAFGAALVDPTFTSATYLHSIGGAPKPRVVTIPLVAAMAVAAIAIVAAVVIANRPERPRYTSRYALQLPDSQRLQNGNFFRVAVSPDGRQIAYFGGASDGTPQLWIRPVGQLMGTAIPGTEHAGAPVFSPDGKRLAFVTFRPRSIRIVSLAGGPSIKLTDSLIDLGGMAWASDGYIYYDGANGNIIRIPEQGGNPDTAAIKRVLEHGETSADAPSPLPDGRGMLFVASHRGDAPSDEIKVFDSRTGKTTTITRGLSAIYARSGHLLWVTEGGVMMAAPFSLKTLKLTGDAVAIESGLSVRRLSFADVAISPDGLLVYTAGARMGDEHELVWLGRDGALTSVDPAWTGLFGRSALSPDGKRVAVTVGRRATANQIWIKELDRGPASKVADAGTNPMWSPDNRTVLFFAGDSLMSVPADGSTLPKPILVGTERRAPAQAELSRDGKWIVYNQAGDIYLQAADGSAPARPLIAGPVPETSPALSPDGRWIAYQSNEGEGPQIYVRPFPNTDVAKHQVSVSGGTRPRWWPNSKELLYIDTKSHLVSVPMSGTATYAAGIPRRMPAPDSLFTQGRWIEVRPDGRGFLMSRAISAKRQAADELVVVENFFEELKARVPIRR